MTTDLYHSDAPEKRYSRNRVLASIATSSILTCLFLMQIGASGDNATPLMTPMVINFFSFSAISLAYIRGADRLLSPIGLSAIFLIYFIGLAPYLHLKSDFWLYLGWSSGQAPWVATWCLLQGVGFIAVFIALWRRREATSNTSSVLYAPLRRRAGWIILSLMVVTIGARALQFQAEGGVSGILSNYALRLEGDDSSTEGMGPLLVVSDMSQVMLCIASVYFLRKQTWFRSNAGLVAFLAVIAAYTIFFSGLRGSRGPTLIAGFYAVALYHYSVRQVSTKFIFAGIVIAASYVSIGSWYKFGGLDAVLDSQSRAAALSDRQIGDGGTFVALRDFSRADVQSLAFKKLADSDTDIAFGRSYLGAATYLVPRSIFPQKPDTFAREKTELRYGRGDYDPSSFTRLVTGQYAELIINFGISVGTLLFFALFFLLLSRAESVVQRVTRINQKYLSPAHLLAPFLIVAPIFFLTTDSNILVMQIFKYALPVAIIMTACWRPR